MTAVAEKTIHEVRTDESSAAGHENVRGQKLA
jgi:hypothetical protein